MICGLLPGGLTPDLCQELKITAEKGVNKDLLEIEIDGETMASIPNDDLEAYFLIKMTGIIDKHFPNQLTRCLGLYQSILQTYELVIVDPFLSYLFMKTGS